MYYFRYFLKCCIKNIARLICKPKILFILLAIILLLFCFGKMEVNAAVTPDDSNWTVLDYTFFTDQTLVKTNNNTTGWNGTIQQFGGFRTFYVPVDYEGQKFGFETESTSQVEVRFGFCRYPYIGDDCFVQGVATSSEIGSFYKNNTIVSPIDIGFFAVSVYNYNNLEDIVIYSRETTADIVSNSTETIINNQEKNTQQILQGQEEMADRITEGQQQIDDTLTSTDYDESVVNIDSSAVDGVDDTSSTQLFTTVFTNFSNLLDNSNWDEVEVIEFGFPYTDKKIELRSDIFQKIVGDSFLYTLITVAWYSLFGLYCFRFVTHIYHSVKSGDILNGLSLKDEVITSTML